MSTHSDVTRFQGALTDGRSAAAAAVEVSLTDTGLEIHAAQGLAVRLWTYGRLRSNVPLGTKADDVLLSLEPDGAETLFVADPAFSRQLLELAPTLSAARQRWRGLRPGLTAVAAVLAATVGLWFFELHPAQAVARLMPQPTRKALGQQVISSMARNRKACETPAARDALDRLTLRLTTAAAQPIAVRAVVLDWEVINAFAVPGGQIVLTRGLVQTARTSDEVAGVLAHELGHAIEYHPETGLVRAMGLAAVSQLVFAGSSGTITDVGLLLTHLRYTRIAEREADAHAMRLLKAAGISPKGFGDFLARVDGRPPNPKTPPKDAPARDTTPNMLEVISTHPPTAERIAVVRAQPTYPTTPALSDADWRALRGACGAAPPMPSDATDPDGEIAETTRTLAANPNDVAALQKRGRAYARKRQYEPALADFTKAVQLKPGDATLRFNRGLALQNLRRYEEALRDYDEAIRLAPNHVGARNGRANTNRALERYEVALTDFDQLIRFNPKFVAAYYNRALVYIDLKQPDDAMRDLTSAVGLDKDYAAAYAQRGLLHERSGARELAIADFRAALAAPAKFDSGPGAHRIARTRLTALGIEAP